jgi:integrase
MKPQNITDNKIRLTTQKTGELVYIPLHSKVRKIIEKYQGELPPSISNQNMNDYLKEIGKLAKITDLFETKQTKGGKVVKNASEKFNHITTHTARRSFATNAFLADIPAISIMKITGHKTERAFLSYIRVTAEQNADKLLNHPFFN